MDERIIKYCTGELSAEEERELLTEAQDDEQLRARIVEYQHLHTLIGLQAAAADVAEGKAKYILFKKNMNRQHRIHFLRTWSRVAAIFLLAFGLSWFAFSYWHTQVSMSATMQEFYTPAGQRAELVLPDGSKVWLNADSRLTYPSVFSKERRVTLTGEAFFRVAKNAEMPFIVSAQNLDIKALGTQFNVRSYPETKKTEVYLKEGSVRSYFPLHEDKGYVMSPGQLLTEENGKFIVKKMDPDELLWMEGIYVFKGQRMEEIVRKLELYYDVDIIVRNPNILDYKYVGKFRQRDGVMTILRVIQRIHHFKIEQNEERNEIILY